MKRLLNIVLCVCALALASCVSDGKTNDNSINSPSGEKGVLVINVATRTEDTPSRDYILEIYKNESGKATLVRKYDSAKAEMQKPEYIWLLEGNYTAKVKSGEAVSATFNEAESYFYGEKSFDIVAGATATVDIVAVMQNVPVEVVFDQTIVDGFHEGYKVEVKANDNVKLTYTKSQKGYFIMPEGVTTLAWNFVGTFEYEDGEQVAINKSGTLENVAPKKSYKLSFKFSKDATGFLGDISVLIDESIDERDDHLAFNPDPELKGNGFELSESCNYAGGEREYIATSLEPFNGVLITANNKTFDPVNSTVAGVAIAGLNTTQLNITLSDEFFNTLPAGAQSVEMWLTDVSGGEVRKALPYILQGANAHNSESLNLWSGTSQLSATVFGAPSNVEICVREGNGEWRSFAATSSGANTYSALVDGVGVDRTYEYKLLIGGKIIGTTLSFATEPGKQIPNGGLEDWCTGSDGALVPYHQSINSYWCTGNHGTAMLSKNITLNSTDVRPGSAGKYSASLDSEYIANMKFAAGNIYIGSWGGMVPGSTNAIVYFGQPFEYNAKPKAIRFWAKWNSGTIDKTGVGVGKSGDPDLCKIFCCMATDRHMVHSGEADATTFSPSDANIKSGDARYNIVLYSAYMETTQSQTEWKQVEIPFTFYGTDPNQVPSHIILTFTCSGYGDFFDGSTSSWMYIDDIELVY